MTKGIFFTLFSLLLASLTLLIVQKEESFWPAFWPNFFADLIIAIFITLLLSRILDDFRKRDAIIIMEVDRTKQRQIWLNFDLKNVGKQKYDRGDIYWHIFLESKIALDDKSIQGDAGRWGVMQTINGVEYNQYSGQTSQSVFPQRSIDLFQIQLLSINRFPGQTQLNAEQVLDPLFNCFFRLSTAYGLIPNPGKATQSDPDILPLNFVKKIEVFRS